jgi:hypothetical protein
LDFINGTVVKQGSRSGTKERNDGIDLRTDFFADKLLLSFGPDSKDASNSKVVDHNGASIEWIKSDVVSITFTIKFFQLRSFFTCEAFDEGIFLEMFFNDVISVDVLLKLCVSELVGGFKDDDRRVSEEGRDFGRSIENGLDN